MKTQNISKLALWVCVGIIAVVLGLFFFVGFDTPSEEVMDKPEPQFTGLLIYSMYAFIIVLGLLTIANLGMAIAKFKDMGLIRVFIACAASMAIYAIFRVICSGQEAPEGADYTGTDMAVADAYIWTIGILFLAAVAVSVLCASGLMSKKK